MGFLDNSGDIILDAVFFHRKTRFGNHANASFRSIN
jgi:hypothetical protein